MAKISIGGNVFIIQSSIQLEKLKLLEKFRPEALKIRDGDGNVTFAVGTGSASINNNGVSFKDTSPDESKFACMTLQLPPGIEDAKRYVADYVGLSFLNLQNVEARLEEALEDIEDDMAEIMGNISYMTEPEHTSPTYNESVNENTDGGEEE